ncbi:hypothetical protein [Parascardovia denticolens]|nr:hypothetical protein [Parascardovia denticolens]
MAKSESQAENQPENRPKPKGRIKQSIGGVDWLSCWYRGDLHPG